MNGQVPAFLAFAAVIAVAQAAAASDWTLGAGVEADDVGAYTTAADVSWSPSARLTLGAVAGATHSDAEQGGFDSTEFGVDAEWWPARHVGVAAGYDAWRDSGNYEKNSVRATLLMGGERVRFGLIGESVSTRTTVQLGVLRDRMATLDFDGSGFGGQITLYGSRLDLHASFLSYSYDDQVDRLLTFLGTPTTTRRPRLEQLGNSAFTAADALLDRAVALGADLHFGNGTLGLGLAQYRELLTDSDTNTATIDFSWPLSPRWTAAVTAGASDSDSRDTTYFLGGRVSFATP
jgi:hypothetical protein